MPKPQYFIFGDIHGYLDKLEDVLTQILPIASPDDYFIFLGDYIDRGPESKGVIELLIDLSKKRKHCIFLKGNHEDMFLDYMGFKGHHGAGYLMNGARSTFVSYQGVKNIPYEHILFIKKLEDYHICRHYPYIFVHAGLKPGIKTKSQDPLDLFWIRKPFLEFEGKWEDNRKVIFGHTPTAKNLPRIDKNKIGIDSGAAYGGPLTVIQLPQEKFFQSEII